MKSLRTLFKNRELPLEYQGLCTYIPKRFREPVIVYFLSVEAVIRSQAQAAKSEHQQQLQPPPKPSQNDKMRCQPLNKGSVRTTRKL